LGDRPVTDGSTLGRHIHLVEDVAERGIRRRPLELDAQRLVEHGVVADGKALQIPQALAATHNAQERHQQQIPGRKPNPVPHPRIRDRPQIADQIEIGNCGGAIGYKEEIPSASPDVNRISKSASDTLRISPEGRRSGSRRSVHELASIVTLKPFVFQSLHMSAPVRSSPRWLDSLAWIFSVFKHPSLYASAPNRLNNHTRL
jgi:hypothetical protein